MATPAQILANRANAQLSTGPRTDAGKAAVAKNRLSHGLNSDCLLPNEDASEFQALADSLAAEHAPGTPTETFLVEEMAHAQWKLVRVRRLEREILKNDDSNPTWAAIAEKFVADCAGGQALLKLNRYENSARRAWYKALNQLRALRNDPLFDHVKNASQMSRGLRKWFERNAA